MLPVVETEVSQTPLIEARVPVGLASLPRLSTPSLQGHFRSWGKQSTCGSDGGSLDGGLGGLSPGGLSRLGTAMSNSELSQRRPHLFDRPTSSGAPPNDLRADITAEHDVSKIFTMVRTAKARAPFCLEVPHGLRLDRRVRGLDFLCNGTRSAAMMDAGRDEDRLRAMAAAGLSETLDGRLKPKKTRKHRDMSKSTDSGGSREASPTQSSPKNQTDSDFGSDEEHEEATSAADLQERAAALMRRTDFFQNMEVQAKGVISVLAKNVKFRKEKRNQVVFRQNDPPGGAWVVLSGKVGVRIWKANPLVDEDCPTPRGQTNQYLTLAEVERRKQKRLEALQTTVKMTGEGNVAEHAEQVDAWAPLNAIQDAMSFSQTRSALRGSDAGKKAMSAQNFMQDKMGSKWKGARSKIVAMVRIGGKQAEDRKPTPAKVKGEEEEGKKKKKGFKAAVGKLMKLKKDAKAPSASSGTDAPPKPTMSGVVGKMLERMEAEKKDAEAIDRRLMEECGLGRYKTCEGFSTFAKDSVLGEQVVELGAGALFGELALQNTKDRAASIVCLEDTEFIYISSKLYDKVIKTMMERATVTTKAKEILQGTKFFKGLEASSPGITEELARECHIHKEVEHQVLFRQGDPPRDCYVVVEGSIEIFIFKEVDGDGKKAKRSSHPTPRSEQEDPKKLSTIREEIDYHEKRAEATGSGKTRKDLQVWTKGARYASTEGNSSFGEASRYGVKVATLTNGAVVGELALQNNVPRAATVRCSEDCVFLLITKDVFQRVLGALVEKMRFFNFNLPGLSKMQYRENHPSILFQRRVFPAGYKFLFEGIFAIEPALFMLFSGAVEYRRFRKTSDNFAYLQGHKPLIDSRPVEEVLSNLSPRVPEPGSGSVMQRMSLAAISSEAGSLLERDPDASARTSSSRLGAEQLAGPTALWTRPLSRSQSQVTCNNSSDAEVFCTMPFLPMGIAEPFTVVAVSNVEAYHIGGPNCDKLPPKLVSELRKHLLKKMDDKLRNWLEMKENFGQAKTWPNFWQSSRSSSSLEDAFRPATSVERKHARDLGTM